MKKTRIVALTLATAVIFSSLPAASADAKAKIKLSQTKLSLDQGRSATLKVKGAKGKVKWSSNKKKVAKVNNKGKVTAVSVGTAKITAKVGGKKLKCTVNVGPATRNLTKVTLSTSSGVEVVTDADAFGKNRKNMLQFDASLNAFARYNLDGKYSTFKTTIVAGNRSNDNINIKYSIFVDGVLKKTFISTKKKKATAISIDVKGAKSLAIYSSNSGDYAFGFSYLADARLVINKKPFINKANRRLNEALVLENKAYTYKEGLMSDTFGHSYDSYHQFDASLDCYAIFNLAGNYTQFSGSIATPENAGSDLNMTMEIYADNNLVYSATGLSRITAPKAFSLDVTGVQQLKIVTSNAGSYPNGFISIFNDRLVEK